MLTMQNQQMLQKMFINQKSNQNEQPEYEECLSCQ